MSMPQSMPGIYPKLHVGASCLFAISWSLSRTFVSYESSPVRMFELRPTHGSVPRTLPTLPPRSPACRASRQHAPPWDDRKRLPRLAITVKTAVRRHATAERCHGAATCPKTSTSPARSHLHDRRTPASDGEAPASTGATEVPETARARFPSTRREMRTSTRTERAPQRG